MTAFTAPVRDLLFVMNEIGDLPGVLALPGHADATPDLVETIVEEAGKFAAGELAPLNVIGDRQGNKWADGVVTTAPGVAAAYRDFVDNGWGALGANQEFGGQGMPHIVSLPVVELWASANLAWSLCHMLTLGAVMAIENHASDALKAAYLPKMISGEWTGTMNLTEPQAGSDLAAIRTRAVPEGGAYRITGTKIFITWGEHDVAENIIHLVLARLPDAPPGVKGISLFVVPKFLVNEDGSLGARNDLVCSSIEHKLGIHGSPTAVMSFGDKGGATGYLVGEANRGLEYMFTMMNHARINVGLQGVAIAERAYQQARDYALDRVQGRPIGQSANAPIVHHPDVKRMLLGMKARIDAMRAMVYFVASQMDVAHAASGETAKRAAAIADLLTPVAKGWCTENGQLVASEGIQVHGGVGFIEETGAAQHLRDARITTIYEGTTGIQANDLAGRKIARDKGVTAKAFVAEMREILPRLDGPLASLAEGLAEGFDQLDQAIAFVLAKHESEPAVTAAGAVPLLNLFGTVTGGWLVARLALSAQEKAATEGDPTGFHAARITSARFYARHVLPTAQAYLVAMIHGSDSTLGFDADWF
ncbi:acyl-CoA dehydrogenase [Rhodoblastus sp. 17X3]|uniref:acyl-CoA dehydrogenase n=1 Tax=Rhodoblastus sp. 17X3 TaxID=3047026 RepID=UPI0024B6BC01|nr:acyl-CoA dehydrogenase [Rhodoblastus sp. 17X3]MDI9850234.1 acyl-CoA dehydrogenase [Rhodoblastus sp. 17X3]